MQQLDSQLGLGRCRPRSSGIHGVGIAIAILAALTTQARADTIWQAGDVITHRQDIWGDPNESAGMLLDQQFNFVYSSALVVGGTYRITFDGASDIHNYMPSSGPPASLSGSLGNPRSSVSGQFGGEVVALKLNVDFSDAGHTLGALGVFFGDILIHSYAPLPQVNGLSVRQFLAQANTLLGGGTVGYTPAQANALAVQLNAAFGGGGLSPFANANLMLAPTSTVPEPSAFALLLLGVGALLVRLARRA